VRCNEILGAQGVENAEATSLASGRNANGSDARYFFADVAGEHCGWYAARRETYIEDGDF